MTQKWSNRTGFILAAAGSAVGLGNIWKLPYVVGNHGGGIFILLYLISVVLFALPALVAEILIGRATGQSPIQAFATLGGKKNWQWLGAVGVLAGLIILSFYSVVGGWTIYYSLLGALQIVGLSFMVNLPQQGDAQAFSSLFSDFVANPGLNILFHAIFMFVTILVVMRGVSGGIEKASRVLMTTLVFIIIALACYALTLPGAVQAWEFMSSPQPGDVSSATIIEAVGHSFFSLSVGMGAMLTYGSYLDENEKIASTSVIVAIFDTVIALLASFALFAIGFSANLEPGQGPGLVFITIPLGLSALPFGSVFTFLFFGLLFCAALTSAMSLLEVVVASLSGIVGAGRAKSTVCLGLTIFLLGVPSAVSGSDHFFGVGFKELVGMSWFDLMDMIGSYWLLPLGALGTLLFTGWVISDRTRRGELDISGRNSWIYKVWLNLARFVAPAGIGFVFLQFSGILQVF